MGAQLCAYSMHLMREIVEAPESLAITIGCCTNTSSCTPVSFECSHHHVVLQTDCCLVLVASKSLAVQLVGCLVHCLVEQTMQWLVEQMERW